MGVMIMLFALLVSLIGGVMATTHPISGIIVGVVCVVAIIAGLVMELKGVD